MYPVSQPKMKAPTTTIVAVMIKNIMVLAYAARYMPLVTEICIRNFKFELIAPTTVLNRNARSAFDAAH